MSIRKFGNYKANERFRSSFAGNKEDFVLVFKDKVRSNAHVQFAVETDEEKDAGKLKVIGPDGKGVDFNLSIHDLKELGYKLLSIGG